MTGLAEARPLIDELREHVAIAQAKVEVGGAGRPLAGKSFVFTGKLQTLARSEAEKRVRALGAAVLSAVSKAVTYLVLGQEKDGAKSTKQKAAEKLVSQGEPITILSEAELVTMLEGLGTPQAQAEEDGEAANPPEQMAPGKAAKTDKKQGELF